MTSRFVQFGISADALSHHIPLNELDEKFRDEVIRQSRIIDFKKDDAVFFGKLDRSRYYYLLKGSLGMKTGILSSKHIAAEDEICLFDISPLIPDDVYVMAAEDGYILSIDSSLIDTALAWSRSEILKNETPVSPISDLPKASLRQLSKVISDVQEDDWMSLLLRNPLFFNLPPANIARVFSNFQKVAVKKGDVIVKQGDEAKYFYVLIHGSASTYIDGVQSTDMDLVCGSYFGESAIVANEPRWITVIMNEDGEVGKLDKETFRDLLQDSVVNFISRNKIESGALMPDKVKILLDVRSMNEFQHSPVSGAMNIPCNELRARIGELDRDAVYLISHEGGKRSQLAAHILSQENYQAFVLQ